VGHNSGIGVLDKALSVLDTVATAPAALSDLMTQTGLPRATAHRLAVALEFHRLLARDSEGRFVLGSRIDELASARLDPLLDAAGAVLAGLRDECEESAQLYRRDGINRICIAVAERATGLRTTVPVGLRLPMTAGSGAQILLAWESDDIVEPLLAQAQFTERVLGEVRRRGWAQSIGEREVGVASVSAPVVDANGNVIAAISISGPIERLGRTPGRTFGARVVAAAARLSASGS
jgi:DNA-binding IclR family transcriptional regulator